MAAPTRRGPSLLESFNFAFEGVIHVLRTQRNMRIHFAIAAAVLIAAVAAGVGRIESNHGRSAPAELSLRGDISPPILGVPLDGTNGTALVRDTDRGELDGVAFVRFGHEDVVRHKLVQRIVEAYRKHAEETGTQRRK